MPQAPEPEDIKKRLPPGQLLTKRFPVLHYGAIPAFNPATWTFQIWGEVEKALRTWLGLIHGLAARQPDHGHPLRDDLELA